MATPDQVPAEVERDRQGPQLTAGEARTVASDREVTPAGAPGAADASGDMARGASGGAGQPSTNPQATDDMMHSEAALGGADSVQKTTFGVGTGGEPNGRAEMAPVGLRKGEGGIVARTSPGGGVNPAAWVVGVLAALAAVVYGFGLLSG